LKTLFTIQKYIGCFAFILSCASVSAFQSDSIVLRNNGNLRSASAVKNHLWVSGANGSIARIALKKRKALETKEYTNTACKNCDYRGIHAWDSLNAIAISSGIPCVIIKTKDGGKSWQKVFEQTDSAWFLDAIKFTKDGKGYVLADPINGAIPILTTTNFGTTWKVKYWRYPYRHAPSFYAASNSSLGIFNNNLMVCGGLNNAPFLGQLTETNDSFFLISEFIGIPKNCLDKKENYFGYYGMCVSKNTIYTCGGSFNCPIEGQFAQIFQLKNDIFWLFDTIPLKGYYSGVHSQENKLFYAGTNGISVFDNKVLASQDSQVFNAVVQFDKSRIAWVGAKGTIRITKIK